MLDHCPSHATSHPACAQCILAKRASAKAEAEIPAAAPEAVAAQPVAAQVVEAAEPEHDA